jgi:hypothetical protein
MSNSIEIDHIERRLRSVRDEIQTAGNIWLDNLPDRVIELAEMLWALTDHAPSRKAFKSPFRLEVNEKSGF